MKGAHPIGVQQTSLFAWHTKVKPSLGERQKAVLAEIRKAEHDMTNAEIAASMHVPINCITPRTFELRRLGLVEEATRRPCRVTGSMAMA